MIPFTGKIQNRHILETKGRAVVPGARAGEMWSDTVAETSPNQMAATLA